ncbi:MAG TPA: hypothetical protein VFO22_06280 [Candidatus Udaeobacter sp.]|nr:hypothetical protein [Candidatus Udaeobacter sp.]
MENLGVAFQPYEFAGVGFWAEDAAKPGARALIKFERKFNAPFSANHYFAQAPLETKSHFELLNQLEVIMRDEQRAVQR